MCFSDETSVVLGHRRGGDFAWRNPEERFDPTVMRRRWKGYSEFMFYGCFLYNFKGPYHCWKPETAAEKRQALKKIEALNNQRQADLKAHWDLSVATRRINLNRINNLSGSSLRRRADNT